MYPFSLFHSVHAPSTPAGGPPPTRCRIWLGPSPPGLDRLACRQGPHSLFLSEAVKLNHLLLGTRGARGPDGVDRRLQMPGGSCRDCDPKNETPLARPTRFPGFPRPL